MSTFPTDDSNPFQAPKARIGEFASRFEENDIGNAELIRREHLSQESSVKSLGSLYYLGAFFGFFASIGLILLGSGVIPIDQGKNQDMSPEMMKYVFLGVGVFYILMTILFGFLGYGLRRLQVWARWTVVVLMCLSLVYTLVVGLISALANPILGLVVIGMGSIIPGIILYVMVAPKSSMVFSPEYKLVIAMTPHVKAKMSLILKLFLGLLVAVLLLIVIAAIVAPRG